MQPDPGATIDAPPTTTTATATRTAGPVQGILLVAMSCLSVLGAVLLAPVQPRISEAFAGQPGVPALVPLVITVPALVIGLLAPFAGRLIDRLGRLRILPGALVVYAVFGTAPLWLSSLPLIVASRAGVGLAEAAIMTCATTLIADYFDGRRRDRYLGLQVVFTSISAVVFIGLGGALASTDWRTQFWVVPRSAWPELSGRRNARNCCSCRSHVIGAFGFCAILSVVFREHLSVARLCARWIFSISHRH
jgi:MFS family permease